MHEGASLTFHSTPVLVSLGLALALAGCCGTVRERNAIAPTGVRTRVPAWAELVREDPDPEVVTDAALLDRIQQTGLAWWVTDKATQIEMLLIPPGTYRRGASLGDDRAGADEKPAHDVTLTEPVYVGRTEVTNRQYRDHFEHDHDSKDYEGFSLNADDQPVVSVSWNDARSFCDRNGFVLPTEGQWEYAARGGTTTRYPWGDAPDAGRGWANVQNPSVKQRFGWTGESVSWEDGHTVTAPVASFRPNGFGLCDVIGNVWEWCSDAYDPREYERHASGVTDPEGPASGSARVLRGGSWFYGPSYCRSSRRGNYEATGSTAFIGFRVARAP